MWFWWAILGAFLAAVVAVLNKQVLSKVNASVLSWTLFSLNIPLVIWLAWRQGFGEINWSGFLLGVVGSATVFAAAKTLAMSGLKQGRLSLLAPLASFHPATAYILGLIFLGETVSVKAMIGLTLVVVGVYLLKFERADKDLLLPLKKLFTEKDSLKVVIASVITSVSAVFDKIAIISVKPDNPALVLLGENLVITLLLAGYLSQRKPGWLTQVKNNFKSLALQSLIYAFSVIAIFKAFALGPIALAVGIKQLQLIVILLLGWWWLKDRPKPLGILAAVIMVAGAILIKLA